MYEFYVKCMISQGPMCNVSSLIAFVFIQPSSITASPLQDFTEPFPVWLCESPQCGYNLLLSHIMLWEYVVFWSPMGIFFIYKNLWLQLKGIYFVWLLMVKDVILGIRVMPIDMNGESL